MKKTKQKNFRMSSTAVALLVKTSKTTGISMTEVLEHCIARYAASVGVEVAMARDLLVEHFTKLTHSKPPTLAWKKGEGEDQGAPTAAPTTPAPSALAYNAMRADQTADQTVDQTADQTADQTVDHAADHAEEKRLLAEIRAETDGIAATLPEFPTPDRGFRSKYSPAVQRAQMALQHAQSVITDHEERVEVIRARVNSSAGAHKTVSHPPSKRAPDSVA